MSRSRAATGPYRPLYCWIGCAANNTDLYARAATERARARKMHRSTCTSFASHQPRMGRVRLRVVLGKARAGRGHPGRVRTAIELT